MRPPCAVPRRTPAEVADQLQTFVAAGTEHISLVPAAESTEAAIDHAAEVRSLLRCSTIEP